MSATGKAADFVIIDDPLMRPRPKRTVDLIWNRHTRLDVRVEIREVYDDGWIVRVDHCPKCEAWEGNELWLPKEHLAAPPTRIPTDLPASIETKDFTLGTMVELTWDDPDHNTAPGQNRGAKRRKQWRAWAPGALPKWAAATLEQRKRWKAVRDAEAHLRELQRIKKQEDNNPLWGLF